jgi:HD-like signal output (HDOD) protein
MDQLLGEIDALPPTPQILPKLQSLLRRDDTDLTDLRDVIKVDAGLTAQIIRTANSSFFGSSMPVESLSDALGRLGFRETYRMASYFCSKEVLNEAMPLYGLKQSQFLLNSVISALLMSEFAKRIGRHDGEALYTIGLLHGIGRVVINRYFLAKGINLYDHDEDGVDADFSEDQIHAIVGFSFARIGAELLRKWKFSEFVTDSIEHQLEEGGSGSVGEAIQLLRLANDNVALIQAAAGAPDTTPQWPVDAEALESVGLSAEQYQLCMLRTLAEFAMARKLLS